MSNSPRPISEANWASASVLLTDVDGTLTVNHKLPARVIAALERLNEAGLPVVLVTGRPAGFGECWLRTLPVEGVIVENGGLYFTRTQDGRLKKVYARGGAQLLKDRARLRRETARVMRQIRGLKLSTDSLYTEVDLALDYNEEARLKPEVAEAISAKLASRGVSAVRSSVHVNCWIGKFDKASMARKFLKNERGLAGVDGVVYVGDSLNDAPMFEAFPLSVGVANVLDVLDELDCAPAYVTRAREGDGFVELADAVLAARRGRGAA